MRRALSSEQGAGVVEFAIIFPVFLLVVGGIIEAGRLIYLRTSLEHATRTAARAAIVRSEQSLNPASVADVVAIISRNAVVNTARCVPDIRYSAGNKPGSTISVEMECPFEFVFPLISQLGIFSVSAATDMVVVN